MYLKNVLIRNSGPLSKIVVDAEFSEAGIPKPIVFTGVNGSGKTNLLAIIADSLIEMAAQHYQDITERTPAGRSYFRVLGGVNVKIGSEFELCLIKYEHKGKDIFFRNKVGPVSVEGIENNLTIFGTASQFSGPAAEKVSYIDTEVVTEIFSKGCYVYFSSNRQELPHWQNDAGVNSFEKSQFDEELSHFLRKPISVSTAFARLKPWLVDVILDQSVDAFVFLENHQAVIQQVFRNAANISTLNALNDIIRIIVKNPKARIVRTTRGNKNRKIQIHTDNEPLLPSLQALSSGQATLFAMFATIIQYGDTGETAILAHEIEGIVVVDEIDVHLHTDLLYDALPKLMSLFPKIQFILTAHSPLFLLGLENKYGDNGSMIIDLPDGIRIGAERFSEFLESFKHYQNTKKFEGLFSERILASKKTIILCEGETDVKYITKAMSVLGYSDLIDKIEIDSIGIKEDGRAKDSGKDEMNKAVKFLSNNPSFLINTAIFIYDCDATIPRSDVENLHILKIERIESNSKCLSGIENLLPEVVFEDQFYERKVIITADRVTRERLQKVMLCDSICDSENNFSVFNNFKELIEKIKSIVESIN